MTPPAIEAVALFKKLDSLILRGSWNSAPQVIQEALDAYAQERERATMQDTAWAAVEIFSEEIDGLDTLEKTALWEKIRARAAALDAGEGTG